MMLKKGSLVLRDVVFMMMIVSAIFVFAGLFVSEMALNYENTNMTDEWAGTNTTDLANSTFYSTGGDMDTVGSDMQSNTTGIYSLIEGAGNTLKGLGKALFMVLTAPNTIGALVSGTLEDAGVASSIAFIIKYLIVTILWGVIIFTIIAAFLRGGKL